MNSVARIDIPKHGETNPVTPLQHFMAVCARVDACAAYVRTTHGVDPITANRIGWEMVAAEEHSRRAETVFNAIMAAP